MAHQFLTKLSLGFITQASQLTSINNSPEEFLGTLLVEHSSHSRFWGKADGIFDENEKSFPYQKVTVVQFYFI